MTVVGKAGEKLQDGYARNRCRKKAPVSQTEHRRRFWKPIAIVYRSISMVDMWLTPTWAAAPETSVPNIVPVTLAVLLSEC